MADRECWYVEADYSITPLALSVSPGPFSHGRYDSCLAMADTREAAIAAFVRLRRAELRRSQEELHRAGQRYAAAEAFAEREGVTVP